MLYSEAAIRRLSPVIISRFILNLREVGDRGGSKASAPGLPQSMQIASVQFRMQDRIEGNIGESLRTGFWSDNEDDGDEDVPTSSDQPLSSTSSEQLQTDTTPEEKSGIETVSGHSCDRLCIELTRKQIPRASAGFA